MSVQDLFKPLTLLHGPAMRNRFMLAPLTSQQSEYDGTASEYDQHWMEQLAQGGYALVQTSAATVEAGAIAFERQLVGSSRVDLQACKLEYSIVSPK